MTNWSGKTTAELIEEWLRAVEYLQNLHRLRSALREDEQRGGASWKTVDALDEIIAEEALKVNELRYLIEGEVARSDQRLAH